MGRDRNRVDQSLRRFRFWIEAQLVDGAAWLIPRFPRRLVVALANGLGRMGYVVDRRDRRVALANLDLAFGSSLTAKRKREIVTQVFKNFTLTTLDYFWFSRDTKARVERYVSIDASTSKWIEKGPLVAVSAHFGNWEVIGQAIAIRGGKVSSIAKPIKNPRVDAVINRIRQHSGQRIIPREGALKGMLRVLRDHGIVGLLLDQDTRVADGGVFVEFFGVPVPIASAAAGLAQKMNVPILMVYCRNERNGTYRCYSPEVLTPAEMSGLSPVEITARITGFLEAEIRRDPSQWLWTYKRWKRRMPGVEPSRYPFYADC
jgi:KDO2-lipid IV(A) lauroyltransferase